MKWILALLLTTGCAAKMKGEAVANAMDQVWNEGDLSILDEKYDPDAAGEVREFVLENRALYPDIDVTIYDWVVQGDTVVTLWTATGTHKDLGKTVSLEGVSIRRIADGKIVEETLYYDQKSVYDQLGFKMTPPEGATPFGPIPEAPPGPAASGNDDEPAESGTEGQVDPSESNTTEAPE